MIKITMNIRLINFLVWFIRYMQLPNDVHVVNAPSIITFEKRLDKYWKDQPALYNYDEEINIDIQSGATYEEDIVPEIEKGENEFRIEPQPGCVENLTSTSK